MNHRPVNNNWLLFAPFGVYTKFGILPTAFLLGGGLAVMFFFYGTYGWQATIQNVIPSSPWNITIGTMMLIYFALALFTSSLFAVTNAFLSHLTNSSVITMAIHASIVFAGLFNFPGKLGFISKLWLLRPTMALYYGTFCNTFMYGTFNNVQASLLVYASLSLLFIILLLTSYKKSQVASR